MARDHYHEQIPLLDPKEVDRLHKKHRLESIFSLSGGCTWALLIIGIILFNLLLAWR